MLIGIYNNSIICVENQKLKYLESLETIVEMPHL
jgi:hypothetical protein